MDKKEILDNLRNELIKKLNSLLRTLKSRNKEDGTTIVDFFGKQQGEGLEEKSSKIIMGLKQPKYTEKMIKALENIGYKINLKDNKYYINYSQDGEELNIEMPDDIRELCEQLELFDEINLGENEVASQVLIEKVKTNILMNIFCHTSNGEISKEVLEENDNGMNVNDYNICMDSNGAIRVDIKEIFSSEFEFILNELEGDNEYYRKKETLENNSYYLPIRFSRKLLPYGIIEKEQDIMRYIDNNLEAIMRNSFKKNSNKLNEAYKLFQELKELRDGTEYNIKYIDGRYYIENNENKSIVEISLELNNHIVELEKNIFKAIRKSKTNEKNDYIKDLDLKSYYSLQKMLDLGFTFEILI